jgi:hypothetical protein
MSRLRKYFSDAERVAAYRARHDLVPVTFDLLGDVVKGLNDYLRFKDQTKNAVMEKLIRSQLLRKR